MKEVLILFGRSNWEKSKSFGNEKYRYSYEYFYDLCKKKEIRIYRASYQWYDYKKHIFKHAWAFEKKSGGWRRVNSIKPDLIFDKTKSRPEVEYKKSIIGKKYKIFNNPLFTTLIDNKLYVSHLFTEWMKTNILIQDKTELEVALDQTRGARAVVKPLTLSGGENIYIGNKKDIILKIEEDGVGLENYIVQDFIDSSGGIPGVMEGIHDLRMVFMNDLLVYSYYRIPAEGELLANLAQGGSMEIVPIDKLPESLVPIIKKAKDIFSVYSSKIYTMDVMFDEEKRPWIIELNSMPGMYFEPGQEKTRKVFYSNLLEEFNRLLLTS
jgi:glutathione synthase/RimK-type ligase-like ATP-grasp enzyme